MTTPALDSDRTAAGLGATVPTETILALAAEAGFAHAGPAPIEHHILRFFSLRR